MTSRSRAPVREFIVDFLGSLVPGIAFLFAIVPAFVLPVALVVSWTTGASVPIPAFTGQVPLSVNALLLLIFPALTGFFVCAYIVGHCFYRQDPKIADQASVKRLGLADAAEEKQRGMVRSVLEEGRKMFPVEFPYHCLKAYLSDRDIHYLAARIPWDADSEFKRRAKHFANALKIRVYLESPDQYAILARNEGHVRLSSSMWYVCGAIGWASAAGLAVAGVAAAIHLVGEILPDGGEALWIIPAATWGVALWVKVSIENALHYQREREVLFILETAHWLCLTKNPRLFEGLEPHRSLSGAAPVDPSMIAGV